MVDRAQQNWDEWIPYAVAAYRAIVHEVTGYSPNFIVFGRENALPVDLVYGAPTADPSYVSLDEFVAERQRRLRECHCLVLDALGRSAERQKYRYDLKVRPVKFSPGDQVYDCCPRRRVGMSPKWQQYHDGPFEVVEVLGPVTYRIRRSARSRAFVTHADKLKPYRCGENGGVLPTASRGDAAGVGLGPPFR